MHPRRRSARIFALAFAAGVLACAGGDLTLPGDAQPTTIEAVTGNAQAGIAGATLPLPLVVKVTDDLGRPVVGQTVEFSVTDGGGQVASASLQTDTAGRASTAWTLGPIAGAQAVRARAVGRGAPDNLELNFTATAVAGTGSLLAAVSGDDQSGSVSTVLAESLVVHATDGTGNPVGGITIQWTVQGGGSITPEATVTGDDGLAAAERVLGPTAGRQSAQASSDGLAGSPVTFVQTALASTPTALVEVSGNGQAAPAGFEVAEDLVVQLLDADGNGVGGRPVSWAVATGGGTVNPSSGTTDANGLARTRWTLGPAAGTNSLTAAFSGLPPVAFSANASPDVPSKLALAGGNNQSGIVGQLLATPLSVTVTDANDNPVQNVSVAWTAVGGGSVSSATSATNVQGVAEIGRTLGPTPGTYPTTATVSGLTGSVEFTSMASAGAASKLVIVTQPGAAARSGAPLSPSPAVQVQDAQGNNVGQTGLDITAALATSPGGGDLIGARTRQTDGSGRATFSDLGITGPVGSYTIGFSSSGLTSATSTAVTLSAGAVSASLSSVDASPSSVPAGAQSAITVTARDAGGNLIVGAAVVLAATGEGNSLSQPSAPTDAGGVATATFSSTSAGAHAISARIDGTAIIAGATVTVTAGAVSASQTTVTAAPGSVASGVASTVTVTARDASGNPVAGATVVLAADGSGNTLGQPPGPTNAGGVATGTFSSTGLGPHTISATVNGTPIENHATVTVTAGAVSAGRSTVSATPDQIQAGGTPTTVTITARDATDNPVPGASVALSVTGSGNTVSAPAPTNGSGVTTATFTSSQAGPHTITATINTVDITDNAMVTVTPGPVNDAQSTIGASPTSVAIGVNSTITVTARDAGGNPIQGASVALSAPGSGNTVGQPSGATNGSGVTTGTFSSSVVGSHIVSASINGTGITAKATVTVTVGQVSAAQSTVSTTPDAITAGGAPSTVTITARDAGGNPVPGAAVSLTVSGSGNTVSAPGPTNPSGVSTATFTSTEAGTHVISASINGIAIADKADVTVSAGPAASLQFTTQPTSTASNTTISPAPVVRVTDAFGNPTVATVHLDLQPGPLSSGTLTGTVDVTSSGGDAVFPDLSVTNSGLIGFFRLTASVGGQLLTDSDGFAVTP